MRNVTFFKNFSMIKDLEKQENLRIAHLHLKEHQEIIDKLKEIISEKKDEIANMQMDLENSNAKLQEKVQGWGACLIGYLIYLCLKSFEVVKWLSNIFLAVFTNAEHIPAYGPTFLLLGYVPKRKECILPHKNTYKNVHSSFYHNSKKLKITQVLIRRRMDKCIVIYKLRSRQNPSMKMKV